MKVLLTKASDWNFEKIIEIEKLIELRDIGEKNDGEFVIDFGFTKYMSNDDKEKYKECALEVKIYDDYIE